MHTDIVKSVSIDNMLNQRQAAFDLVIQAQGLLKQAQELTKAAHIGGIDFKFVPFNSRNEVRFLEDKAIDKIKNSVDSVGWQYLMNESGLRTFMDAEARRKWDESIYEQKAPEFTRENIEATFEGLFNARGDMFERGVLSVFKSLSWDYKTNKPFKFSKKIIISYLFDGYGHVNHKSADSLDDLMRVFYVLDNKPEPDHRQGMYYQISGAGRGINELNNDYVHVRWYKKGTGHITFKRIDIIDQMNRILAKHYPDAIAERQ